VLDHSRDFEKFKRVRVLILTGEGRKVGRQMAEQVCDDWHAHTLEDRGIVDGHDFAAKS
jgi:hypothetical protein